MLKRIDTDESQAMNHPWFGLNSQGYYLYPSTFPQASGDSVSTVSRYESVVVQEFDVHVVCNVSTRASLEEIDRQCYASISYVAC